MASVASRARALPSVGSLPAGFVLPALVLLVLLAVSLYLRTKSLGESLWMDEGLSIGIASQPLFDIPGVLRVDGSPPLYYMLLSVWMDVFGNGPAETQGLSMVIALLAVPGGLWAGWSLFGRRAGLICAALCAVNPFLTDYAQETRMYSLMLLLSLLATAAFLHVFAFGRRSLPAAVRRCCWRCCSTRTTGACSWRAGSLVALVPCWYVSEDRARFCEGRADRLRRRRPALPAVAAHAAPPDPAHRRALAQLAATSARRCRSRRSLLGGGTPTVALLLAGGSGLAAVILQRRVRGQGAHRGHRWRGARARHARRGLARVAGLARVDHALPRRDARAAAAAWARSGSRAPASSGWSRS